MTAPVTPGRGIRLADGAPIPPAPTWGTHRPVTLHGRRLGSIVEITHGHHVPVCVALECYRALPARDTYPQGRNALLDHWVATHTSRRTP